MKRFFGIRLGGVLSPLLLSAVFVACSDDGNDAPPDKPPVIGTGGKKHDDAGTSGGKSGGSGGKSGGSGGDAPDSSTGGGDGDGGGSGDGGGGGDGGGEGSGGSAPIPDSGTCTPGETGEKGCFKCPTTTAEYHNQCTTSSCYPFDNEARLRRFNGYPLPALQ